MGFMKQTSTIPNAGGAAYDDQQGIPSNETPRTMSVYSEQAQGTGFKET